MKDRFEKQLDDMISNIDKDVKEREIKIKKYREEIQNLKRNKRKLIKLTQKEENNDGIPTGRNSQDAYRTYKSI